MFSIYKVTKSQSLKLVHTKYGYGALLGNMYMLYEGPKGVKSKEI